MAANISAQASLELEKLAIQLLIDAALEVKVALQLLLDSIQLAVDASLDLEATATIGFSAAIQTPGLHVYRYNGRADELGSGMTVELAGGVPLGSGPSQNVNALVIVASDGSAWGAMQFAFKTNLWQPHTAPTFFAVAILTRGLRSLAISNPLRRRSPMVCNPNHCSMTQHGG